MPCIDHNTHSPYPNNIDNSETYKKLYSENEFSAKVIIELKAKIHTLDAYLCAILSELEKRKIAKEIIENGSKFGKIDLMEYWKLHKIKDEVRLKTDLEKYSQHEIEIIKTIINQ